MNKKVLSQIVVTVMTIVLLGSFFPLGYAVAQDSNFLGPHADDLSGVPTGNSNGFLSNISQTLARLENIINVLIPFIVGLAVLVIIYGIFGYITEAANEEKRKEAKDFIIWGFVGLFIMLSIWGLLNILVNTFPLNNRPPTYIPPLPTPANPGIPKNIPDLLNKIGAVFVDATPFVLALATFIIIVGAVNYIRQAGNEEKVKEAKAYIIWGLISLFVMVSIWGIVNVLIGSFQFNNRVSPNDLPVLPLVR